MCFSLKKTKNTPFDPINFKNVFSQYNDKYANNSQHDSLEFLRIFLDDISEELNKEKIIPEYKDIVINIFILKSKIYTLANVGIFVIHLKNFWIFLCCFRKKRMIWI